MAAKGTVVMLRLDDDDLMSVDFLHQLTPHVTPSHWGWCVSLGRGIAARPGSDGLVDFREVVTPLIAIGQAFVGTYHPRGHQLALSPLLSHRRVSETLPTVLDSRSVAWVHVRHPLQDSHVAMDAKDAHNSMLKGMRRLTPVKDFAALRPKFPTLADSFDRAGRH